MGLQTAFYIVAIVFMGLMLLLMAGLVVAILVIKAKINAIHRQVDEKLAVISNIAHTGAEVVNKAKRVVQRR